MANERLLDFPAKPSPVGADIVYVGDSADSFNEVQSTIEQIFAGYSPALASLAGLSSSANQLPYFSGVNTFALTSLTAFGRSLLADVDNVAARSTLGLGTAAVLNTPITLAFGGTGANLTAANGGIVYSTATTLAISAVGSSGQLFQSGGAGAPGWTTATYPSVATGSGTILRANGTNWVASTSTFADTYAINTLLYASSANTVVSLATANNGVLITSAGGVPSISSTLPSAVQTNITALGTQAQALNMGGFDIGNIPSVPSTANSAASKAYVDTTALNGTSVYAATTTNLNVTQAGAGVGATLTDASGTFAPFSIDGVSPPVGSNSLIKNLAAPQHEGIYALTTNGDGISVPYQLTRATSYDTAVEINNTGLIIINNGATLAGTAWYNSATIVTVDTTNFNYSSFGATGTVTSVTFTGDGTVLSSTPSSAVTSSGTLTASLKNQTANTVLAGPTSGGSAASTFRSLVAADLPSNGTYTPTIVPDVGNFNTLTFSTQLGTYIQLGNLVIATVSLQLSAYNSTGSSGSISITLPITPASNGTNPQGAVLTQNVTYTGQLTAQVTVSQPGFYLIGSVAGGSANTVTVSGISATSLIRATVAYFV